MARLAVLLALLAVTPGPAHAHTYVVELSNFAVEPRALTIRAGDTVEWRITSGRHSSTAKDAGWDSGELKQGASFAHRFDVPASIPISARRTTSCAARSRCAKPRAGGSA